MGWRSGIIHKEENRISTDVRAATDEKSRNTDHPSDNQGNECIGSM
jgi:hypothetical protein